MSVCDIQGCLEEGIVKFQFVKREVHEGCCPVHAREVFGALASARSVDVMVVVL
jgi:hypothetical protein